MVKNLPFTVSVFVDNGESWTGNIVLNAIHLGNSFDKGSFPRTHSAFEYPNGLFARKIHYGLSHSSYILEVFKNDRLQVLYTFFDAKCTTGMIISSKDTPPCWKVSL